MRVLILAVFVALFALLPLYLLDTEVMPQLGSLEYSYAHQDQTVQALFPGS